jgi:hypothetical protein
MRALELSVAILKGLLTHRALELVAPPTPPGNEGALNVVVAES